MSTERYYFAMPGLGKFRVPEKTAVGGREAAVAYAIRVGAVNCVAEHGPVGRPTRIKLLWHL